MPNYISPLDDRYVRFDGASECMASRNNMNTPDGMLEMLTIAMWQGHFNPPPPDWSKDVDKSFYYDPENWLAVPIEQPQATLNEGQRALKPNPYAYYEAGRDTIISVMYCSDLLPGDREGWHGMLEGGDGLNYLHDKHSAFAALARLPLHSYSEHGKDYLRSLYIPRHMLQAWLNCRSLDFQGLFVRDDSEQSAVPEPANDTPSSKRGRPILPSWEMIKDLAIRLHAEEPDRSRKQLAGLLYTMALERYERSDVPGETTILRRLAELLNNKNQG